MMKREKNLHFLGMAVMIAVSMPASWLAVRAAEIPAAPAEDDMAFRMAGVTVEAKRPDWESKLSPGTVTVIRPEEFKGEQKDLADFLKMVPGVHVREVNGKGRVYGRHRARLHGGPGRGIRGRYPDQSGGEMQPWIFPPFR